MATILVVDDDSGVREIVGFILKQKGHEILPASNGLEALMVYSSYRARLDLVLTDIDMPQMNGLELASRIRSRDPAKKILLMSGRALEDLKDTTDYPMIPKPFAPDQLLAAVDNALEA